MQLAGVAFCGHGDKASLFIVRGQKPLIRTERERETSCDMYHLTRTKDYILYCSKCCLARTEPPSLNMCYVPYSVCNNSVCHNSVCHNSVCHNSV